MKTFTVAKNLLLIFFILPAISFSQSKKQKKALEKADNETISNLKSHVQYLASDKLEGRRTGTTGELLAMEYIAGKFKQYGLEATGSRDFVQEFPVDEGKQPDSAKTYFLLNGKKLDLNKDFFPLPYCSGVAVTSHASPSLSEKGEAWFWDLKEVVEENVNNPHFDIFETISSQLKKTAAKGAKALILYNTSARTDNVQFNKFDTTAVSPIPVFYITPDATKKYLQDATATYDISLASSITKKRRTGHNVIGFINNNAPTTIILGAHYDHLGYGEDNNALDGFGQIHNGADDNASGTAALIELARLLKSKSAKTNNYLFIAFSGEELGLFGSKYWLQHPTVSITPNYMINMDMIGRYDTARKLMVGGYGTSPSWSSIIRPAITKDLVIKLDSAGSGPSDHASFYRNNIPVLFLFTNSHPDYHKATDDWEKINFAGELRIIKFVQDIINASSNAGQFAFTKTKEAETGRATFTVSLGVVPDYGYAGVGVRIDGISKGKLAERIGLQAGDILLQLGEYKFVDVVSYMGALNKFKKGDNTRLKIKRGSEEKEFEITF